MSLVTSTGRSFWNTHSSACAIVSCCQADELTKPFFASSAVASAFGVIAALIRSMYFALPGS